MTPFADSGKPKRTIASLQIERRYRNVPPLFLSGRLPDFTHHWHVRVAAIPKRLLAAGWAAPMSGVPAWCGRV